MPGSKLGEVGYRARLRNRTRTRAPLRVVKALLYSFPVVRNSGLFPFRFLSFLCFLFEDMRPSSSHDQDGRAFFLSRLSPYPIPSLWSGIADLFPFFLHLSVPSKSVQSLDGPLPPSVPLGGSLKFGSPLTPFRQIFPKWRGQICRRAMVLLDKIFMKSPFRCHSL